MLEAIVIVVKLGDRDYKNKTWKSSSSWLLLDNTVLGGEQFFKRGTSEGTLGQPDCCEYNFVLNFRRAKLQWKPHSVTIYRCVFSSNNTLIDIWVCNRTIESRQTANYILAAKNRHLRVATVHQQDAYNACNSTIGFGSIKSYTNCRTI